MTRSRAVVVVAYGAPDYLPAALAPLSGETVVVVDNSSSPGTRALVDRLGHRYVDAGANLGFAGGVNRGLRHLADLGHTGDVLLLNPDAEVETRVIDRLQAALVADDRLAAVAPSLVGADGTPQLTTYPLPSPGQMWRFAVGLGGRWDENFVIGAVLLLRAEALADVGEFDERYFLYGEEVDWQRRALDLGWRVAELTTERALHHGGMSSDDDEVRITRVVAGQEAYVHRRYGAGGSASFRGAGWLATMLRSRSGTWGAARLQARAFRLGPRRLAPLPPSPLPLSILHLARETAGERAVAETAAAQARAGHVVTVVAGQRPPAAVAGVHRVDWRRSGSLAGALRQLRVSATYDVIHAHGTRSLLTACATGAWHGARIVATVDPDSRAPWPVRAAVALLGRRVDVVLPAPAEIDLADGYRAAAASVARKTNIA